MAEQTYTVVHPASGRAIDRNLSAIEAFEAVMSHDGYAYEIRPEEDGQGYRLWHSDGSANSPRGARHLRPTVVFSLESDEAAATQEIALRVIDACGGWRHSLDVMTDEDYDAMLREMEQCPAETHKHIRA